MAVSDRNSLLFRSDILFQGFFWNSCLFQLAVIDKCSRSMNAPVLVENLKSDSISFCFGDFCTRIRRNILMNMTKDLARPSGSNLMESQPVTSDMLMFQLHIWFHLPIGQNLGTEVNKLSHWSEARCGWNTEKDCTFQAVN